MSDASHKPCQPGSAPAGLPLGTPLADKDRAMEDTPPGSEGGPRVRTLSQDRVREKKTEALLALLEAGPDLGVEQDSVAQFIVEHGLEPGTQRGIPMADLYRMYEGWVGEGERVSPKPFTRRMRAAGFIRGPRLAPGKTSYAVLMAIDGARYCRVWLEEHPAEYGYALRFKERLLQGQK